MVEIGGIKTCFEILEKECKNKLAGLDELNRNVRWTIQQETEKVFHSLKMEQERLAEMEINIRSIETLKLKVETVNASVSQLIANMGETQEAL